MMITENDSCATNKDEFAVTCHIGCHSDNYLCRQLVTINSSTWQHFTTFHFQCFVRYGSGIALQGRHMNVKNTCLKSSANRLFSTVCLKLTTKKTSKLDITGRLWGKSTGHRWIPPNKMQVTWKAFLYHDATISGNWDALTSSIGVDPISELGNTRVDTGESGICAADAPTGHPLEGVLASRVGTCQWASGITLETKYDFKYISGNMGAFHVLLWFDTDQLYPYLSGMLH